MVTGLIAGAAVGAAQGPTRGRGRGLDRHHRDLVARLARRPPASSSTPTGPAVFGSAGALLVTVLTGLALRLLQGPRLRRRGARERFAVAGVLLIALPLAFNAAFAR